MGTSGWTVQVWWGTARGLPYWWQWWSDHHRRADAVIEQQRLEYYHGHPSRVVERSKRKTARKP